MDGESGRVCSVCGDKKGTEDFSKKQWLAKAHSRKCKTCVDSADKVGPPPAMAAASSAVSGKKKANGSAGNPEQKVRESGGDPDQRAKSGKEKRTGSRSAVVQQMDEDARARLQNIINGETVEEDEEDPFVCDISGALISMIKDGRYHFNDGRGPDDPSAVCMSVAAYKIFDTLAQEHPDTWEPEYADKSKWEYIPAGSSY